MKTLCLCLLFFLTAFPVLGSPPEGDLSHEPTTIENAGKETGRKAGK